MERKRRMYAGGMFAGLLVALGIGQVVVENPSAAQAGQQPGSPIPMFEVDPMWPKPLPNNWVVGAVIGVAVDSRDHVWIVHRPGTLAPGEIGAAANPPTSECCVPAPPVIEFDPAGNVVQAWGGPGQGYEWPESEHGLFVDSMDNIWIGGVGASDAQILKFSRTGSFLLQIGHQGMSGGNSDTQNLGRPADIAVDPTTNEVYVADGYGNRRVIVFDAETGAYKRHWGAYGEMPDDVVPAPSDPLGPAPERFGDAGNGVHCVAISNQGLVYVCDRQNSRIQVFQRDGTFDKEVFITRAVGVGRSAWDVAFSPDAAQEYLYDVDAGNQKVWTLRRDSLEVLGRFGQGGRWAGQFYGAHSVATDSLGNLFVGETYEGKRVQKFVYQGLGVQGGQ